MTPEEINREIAEKVMGWHSFAFHWCKPAKDADGEFVMPIDDWDPYHRIDHAWMVVEKITSIPTTLEESERAWNTRFMLLFERASLWACNAKEAAKRISLAALEAVKEEKGVG